MICANPITGVEYKRNKKEYEEYHDLAFPVSPRTKAVNKVNPPDIGTETIRPQMEVRNALIATFISAFSAWYDPICIPPSFVQM